MSCANEMLFVITNLNGDNSVFRANFAALPKSCMVTKTSTVSAAKKALSLFKRVQVFSLRFAADHVRNDF